MIKRKDHQWTTVSCSNCKNCHKVLNDKFMRALLCPYCGTTIMLSEGKAPVIGNAEDLAALNRLMQVEWTSLEQVPADVALTTKPEDFSASLSEQEPDEYRREP